MIIALCGTPGVGKTTLSRRMQEGGFDTISLKDLILNNKLFIRLENGTEEMLVDEDKLEQGLRSLLQRGENDLVVDGHLSYLAPFDLCIVLRLNPDDVGSRLAERGYTEEKVRENKEAEAVGSVLVEALLREESRDPTSEGVAFRSEKVFEVDATGKVSEQIFDEIKELISSFKGKKLNELSRYRPGSVDWLEVAAGWY
jgi:adenylate kinase